MYNILKFCIIHPTAKSSEKIFISNSVGPKNKVNDFNIYIIHLNSNMLQRNTNSKCPYVKQMIDENLRFLKY